MAPAENTGGPLLIKLPDALVGGTTTGGVVNGGEVKGLGLGPGRPPRVGGGGASELIGPGGGAPETGEAPKAEELDGGRELGGGLDTKDGG